MSMEQVERIAETVLYEGYMLFPYRRSSLKNQQRWTFGGVYPRRYSEQDGDDPWEMLTECLVVGDERTAVEVKVRFLQVADLLVAQQAGRELAPVKELRVGDSVYRPWEEAIERTVAVPGPQGEPPLRIGDLLAGRRRLPIAIAEGRTEEPLSDPSGARVGALIRAWRGLEGTVEIDAEPLSPSSDDHASARQGYRLRVRIANLTPWAGVRGATASEARHTALRQTFVSTHTILRVQDGEFVSLLEPPERYQAAAAACTNIRTWPVLVGRPGERHTILSSPIILYDYPQISPESPGDLFDATEIDELLTLSIMTLSDEEKQEMRESDPRTRAMLERTESLTPEQIARLHGAVRSLQVLRDGSPQRHRDTERERGGIGAWAAMAEPGSDGLNGLAGGAGMDLFSVLGRAAPASVRVGGVEIARGSRVRLHPRRGGDIFDLALAGKVAFVEAIEQDFEDAIHVAVTVEDDPGRDLGDLRQPGHRFFFSPEELEPLPDPEEGAP